MLASFADKVRHLVEEGIDGLLFDPSNNVSLVYVCRHLTTNKALAQRLAEAGRSKRGAMDDWDVITRYLLSIYEGVIRENPFRQ